MQALSCALLVAAANGFYSPQQKAKVAPRALARAAKEGQAAAGEKQRIVQRSVVKTRQPHHELQIYDDSQQRAQQLEGQVARGACDGGQCIHREEGQDEAPHEKRNRIR